MGIGSKVAELCDNSVPLTLQCDHSSAGLTTKSGPRPDGRVQGPQKLPVSRGSREGEEREGLSCSYTHPRPCVQGGVGRQTSVLMQVSGNSRCGRNVPRLWK